MHSIALYIPAMYPPCTRLSFSQGGSSTIFMTPDDFIRSITPGIIQPHGLGLDKFRNLTIQVCVCPPTHVC